MDEGGMAWVSVRSLYTVLVRGSGELISTPPSVTNLFQLAQVVANALLMESDFVLAP